MKKNSNNYYLYNCTLISSGKFIKNAVIKIENGIITSVDETSDNETTDNKMTTPERKGLISYDLGGRLVMPGFVNPHSHLYSSLAAGLSPKAPYTDFQGVLDNLWWALDSALDEESVYYSAVSGILNAVKHGVTCIFDHHASMNYVTGSLSTIEKAFNLAGIKGVLCFETSDRKSIADPAEHIRENIDFINTHADHKSIRGMLGLHANFTLSEKTLSAAAEAVQSSGSPAPTHVHCGEAVSDLEFCQSEGFKGPIDRLNNFGLVQENSILAHCIHISGHDYGILNEIQPNIVCNAESNANNRAGKPDRSRFTDYLIGTDGMSFDMVSSLRSQYLLGEGQLEDFSRLKKAFIDNTASLAGEFFNKTGKIEPGYDADIAVLDYIPETPISEDNIIGHLIFGVRGGKAYMTISNGKILYYDGNITFTYESSLKEQIKKSAAKLHRRYYG